MKTTSTIRQDVATVLDLAQIDITDWFEEARRDRDLDLQESAERMQARLDSARSLLDAAQTLREALVNLLAAIGGLPITIFDGPAYDALHHAQTALAAAERMDV